MTTKIILYVPQPDSKSTVQAGGQYTAAKGLIDHLTSSNSLFEVVNTTPSKTNQSRSSKAFAAANRIYKVVRLAKADKSIVFAFTGSFYSIFERLILSLVARSDLALSFRNSEILHLPPKSIKGRLVSLALSRAKVIFVQGEKLKLHLELFGVTPLKVEVVPNWLPSNYDISDNLIKNVTTETVINFIMVARIVKAKGIFEFIEAINLLGNNKAKIKVNILGGGEDLNEAKNYSKSLGLSEVVNFTGWVNTEETKQALNNAHIFVLPSYNEGFPNSILEAMSLGLPIISTDVGAITESVKDFENGFIAKVKDSESLCSCMLNYITQPELISQQSKKSLMMVSKRHNRERNCERLISRLFRNY